MNVGHEQNVQSYVKKPIKLENICRPWKKFQNKAVGPGKKNQKK